MSREHRSLFLIAVAGNLLCWVGDVLLCVFPGYETVSGFTLSPAWANAPLWRFSLSALCGGVAMMGVLCGFYALYQLLRPLVVVPGTMNLGGAGMFAGLYFSTAEEREAELPDENR